ncbi:MAG: YIP1 family protein [Candidatus Diapherotrites archaeon]
MLNFSMIPEILLIPREGFNALKKETEALDGITTGVILFIASTALSVGFLALFEPNKFDVISEIKTLSTSMVFIIIFTIIVGTIAAKTAKKAFNGIGDAAITISFSGYSQAVYFIISLLMTLLTIILGLTILKEMPQNIFSLALSTGPAGMLFLAVIAAGALWWLYVHGSGIAEANNLSFFKGVAVSLFASITAIAITTFIVLTADFVIVTQTGFSIIP